MTAEARDGRQSFAHLTLEVNKIGGLTPNSFNPDTHVALAQLLVQELGPHLPEYTTQLYPDEGGRFTSTGGRGVIKIGEFAIKRTLTPVFHNGVLTFRKPSDLDETDDVTPEIILKYRKGTFELMSITQVTYKPHKIQSLRTGEGVSFRTFKKKKLWKVSQGIMRR